MQESGKNVGWYNWGDETYVKGQPQKETIDLLKSMYVLWSIVKWFVVWQSNVCAKWDILTIFQPLCLRQSSEENCALGTTVAGQK